MNSLQVPAWAHFMLEQIHMSHYATFALVVLNQAPPPQRGRFAKLWSDRRYTLHVAYNRLDDWLFRPQPDAFASKDATELLAGVPIIRVMPSQAKHSDVIENPDLATIRSHDLDVLIRLGFRILKGGILHAARFGVWSYHHGDNPLNRRGPSAFWEVIDGRPVTGSILQILTEDLDNGYVLYRSYTATDPVSVNRTRHRYYWKTACFVRRKLQELHAVGEERFRADVASADEQLHVYSSRLCRRPTNGELLGLFARFGARNTRRRLRHTLFLDQWILLYDLRDGISRSLHRFKRIIPPPDRFWADPHIVYRDGRYYVFIEEFLYRTRKGVIAVLTIDELGNYNAPVTVLERPYHLSYPFIFEHGGDYYMIPETRSNRTIEVYRCVEFPRRWTLHKILMENVLAVDATLFRDRESWRLFVNLCEHPGAPESICDELFLFSATDPLSNKWAPHPGNPIVSDIRRARSAGGLFGTTAPCIVLRNTSMAKALS